MKTKKTAVILFNLGGPRSLAEVEPFLFNLFYDKHIINLFNPLRFIIAKIISNKRKQTAQKIYEHLGGKSPILQITLSQAEILESMLNDSNNKNCIFKVFVCMRYSSPFAHEIASMVKDYNPDQIILLPLYPQYSYTTTQSAFYNWKQNFKINIPTKVICCYYNHPEFINAHTQLILETYNKAQILGKPRLLFSAHSLPMSIINKGDPYAWQTEKNAELIVQQLNISELDWSICYQSKIGPVKWLEPSTKYEILRAKKDNIPIIIIPISFVSEHSETLVELDIEYKKLFDNDTYYFRVPALNINQTFLKCLKDLCLTHTQNQCLKYKLCFKKLAKNYPSFKVLPI